MGRYDLTKFKILIADDQPMIRTILRAILKELGVGLILEADSGFSALQVFEAEKFDFCILDWEMEPGTGFDAVTKIRSEKQGRNRRIPIIMLTEHTEIGRIRVARDVGVNEVLAKPIASDVLVARLVSIIDNPRAFVQSRTYTGPDRRRRNDPDYDGPLRREEDGPKQVSYHSEVRT